MKKKKKRSWSRQRYFIYFLGKRDLIKHSASVFRSDHRKMLPQTDSTEIFTCPRLISFYLNFTFSQVHQIIGIFGHFSKFRLKEHCILPVIPSNLKFNVSFTAFSHLFWGLSKHFLYCLIFIELLHCVQKLDLKYLALKC